MAAETGVMQTRGLAACTDWESAQSWDNCQASQQCSRLISIGCCDVLKVPTDGPASRMMASTNVASVAAAGGLPTAVVELPSVAVKPLRPMTSSSATHVAAPLDAGRRMLRG